MRKRVLVYATPASELKAGDRILSERLVIAEVESAEAFEASNKQSCVNVIVRTGAELPAGMCFLANDMVLVIE